QVRGQGLHPHPPPQARVVDPPHRRGPAGADLALVDQRHGKPQGVWAGAGGGACGAGAFLRASPTIAPSSTIPMMAPIRKLRPFLGRFARTATERVGGGSSVAASASGGSATGPGVGSRTDASVSGPGVESRGSGGRTGCAGVRVGLARRVAPGGAAGGMSRDV